MSTETIRYCLTNMMSNDPQRARMVQTGTITRSLLKLYILQRKQEATRLVNLHYLKNSSYQNIPSLFRTYSASYSMAQNGVSMRVPARLNQISDSYARQ
jgi:hypothetical protein